MDRRIEGPVRRRPSTFIAAAAVVGSLTALAPASAPAAVGLRITSPANGGLATRTPVRMVVRTSSARFRAWLGSTVVTGLFRRRGSTRVATVGLGRRLHYGVNVLSVLTTDSSGRTSFKFSRFVVGRRAPALLNASGPSRSAAPVGVRATTGLGAVFTARLNGRRADAAFIQGNGGGRSALLAANHGLRFGRNTVRIVVYNERSGFFDVETRTVNVPRTRPLVGAGNDQFRWTGTRATLSGLASRPFRPGDRLAYRWRLIRRPRGSNTVLQNVTSSQPSLVPDQRGRYVARLTVSEPCPAAGRGAAAQTCRSSDTVTVIVGASLPIGSQLQTRDASGAIRVDGQTRVAGGENGAYAVFDRDTLQPREQDSGTFQYTAASIGTVESKIRALVSNPPRALVVINGTSGVPSELVDRVNGIIGNLGAAAFDKGRLAAKDAGWSVVGTAGAPAGSASQDLELASDPGKPAVPGAMNGYLQANPANHYYGFAPQDAVAFDTVPSGQPDRGSTVTIGGKSYTATLPASATAGFHVLVLDARSLQLLQERVFTAVGQEADFLNLLTAQATAPSRPLVVIQSIGSPKPGTDPRWNDIANRIEQLGGTAAVFNGLNGLGGYTLVGRPGAGQLAEASTAVTGRPGRLVGDLARTRDYGYEPLLSASTPQPSQELLAIASQAPKPWPDINAAANQYITTTLGYSGTDLRRLFYADYATSTAWTKRQNDVRTLPYPGDGRGFDSTAFQAAKDELADEIGAVVEVEDYVTRLRSPFTEGTKEHVSLQQISLDIQKIFAPKPGIDASPAFQIMSKLFGVAADEFKIPEFKVAGQVAGAMAYLKYLPRPKGEDILGKLQSQADQLGADLDIRYDAAKQAMTQLGLILVSDYGKLSTIGGSILHGIPPKVHSDSWLLPPDPDAIKTPLVKAAKSLFFSTLMRTVWDTWDVRGVGNARDWYCVHTVKVLKETHRYNIHLWDSVPDPGQFRAITGFAAGGAPQAVQRALGIPNTLVYLQHAKGPPDSLVRPLFNPIDRDPNSNNLGLYAPWFYRDFARHGVPYDFKGTC
jgi:hypothetical protein